MRETSRRPSGVCAIGIALCGFLPAAAAGQTGDQAIRLQVGITGSSSTTGLDDPSTVLRIDAVSALMRDIADQPRSEAYIRSTLEQSDAGFEDLMRLRLLRKTEGGYVFTFNYFTFEEHARFLEVLAPYATELADRYAQCWHDFEDIFSSYRVPGVDPGDLAYAVVGAFSLDWDGLDITAERGWRITAREQPGGDRYVLWAKETSRETSLEGLYWGSHNWTAEKIRFTTFGDHEALPRAGVPDVIWGVGGQILSHRSLERDVSYPMMEALRPFYTDRFLAHAGKLLVGIRSGETSVSALEARSSLPEGSVRNTLAFLESLSYVKLDGDQVQLTVPVLTSLDGDMLTSARRLSNDVWSAWLEENYDSIRKDLTGLTAVEYGVSYEELFTQIWHYIFGMTNAVLVDRGLFADPYAEHRAHRGFRPFVFDTAIYESLWEVSGD